MANDRRITIGHLTFLCLGSFLISFVHHFLVYSNLSCCPKVYALACLVLGSLSTYVTGSPPDKCLDVIGSWCNVEFQFQGKVAIVTASTQGIGFSIAERLGLEGASVVISSRRQKNVDEAVEKLKARGIEVFGVVCHVSVAQQRKNLVEKTVQVSKPNSSEPKGKTETWALILLEKAK
ncbi:hypothetical protein TEA_030005 [Camellia sinensis var. sinensis]|uniref:Uncharacterized protein n=1 Tax=Camellia sinensis var. sinensis TaxID=542762 RepID=A0A4S4E141_CAMSN|nr:hypothetical protein TEA_030005 [Camellia sinensis var. sinensis]